MTNLADVPGRKEHCQVRTQNETVARPPEGWEAELLPDDRLRLALTVAWHTSQTTFLLCIVSFLFVVQGILVVAALVQASPRAVAAHRGPWDLLRIFAVQDLLPVAGMTWGAFGRERWLVRWDGMERTRSFLGIPRRCWFTGAALALSLPPGQHRGTRMSLAIRLADGKLIRIASGRPEELRTLGVYLSHHTGWLVTEQ